MKAIARIADDKRHEGWDEVIPLPSARDEEEATQMMHSILKKFNMTLRHGELPRRLLDLKIEELTDDESFDLGYRAYPVDECPLHPSKATQRYEWYRGWNKRQGEDEDDGDGGFDTSFDDEDDDGSDDDDG
jgi:hypothetical protein